MKEKWATRRGGRIWSARKKSCAGRVTIRSGSSALLFLFALFVVLVQPLELFRIVGARPDGEALRFLLIERARQIGANDDLPHDAEKLAVIAQGTEQGNLEIEWNGDSSSRRHVDFQIDDLLASAALPLHTPTAEHFELARFFAIRIPMRLTANVVAVQNRIRSELDANH